MGRFPQVDLSVLPLRGSLKPTPGSRERAGLWQPLGGLPDSRPQAIVGKQILLFLLEARHFATRVSSKIGKSGDLGPAGWSQEAVGFRGAADERTALHRSLQLTLGLLIPSVLLHAPRAEPSVCLSEEAWAWMGLGRSEQPLAPVPALCLSSGGGAWASSVHVLYKCWKYPSLTQQGPGSLPLSRDYRF